MSSPALRAGARNVNAGGAVILNVDITNTGGRAGEEVAQLYVEHLGSAVDRPLKELKDFQRVAIEPGETKTVTMVLEALQLAYWNTAAHAFEVEPGVVRVMIGSSSSNILLEETIEVTGPPV